MVRSPHLALQIIRTRLQKYPWKIVEDLGVLLWWEFHPVSLERKGMATFTKPRRSPLSATSQRRGIGVEMILMGANWEAQAEPVQWGLRFFQFFPAIWLLQVYRCYHFVGDDYDDSDMHIDHMCTYKYSCTMLYIHMPCWDRFRLFCMIVWYWYFHCISNLLRGSLRSGNHNRRAVSLCCCGAVGDVHRHYR